MKPTLFVLAAGMGSRYGGLKQLDGLGPNGETIMDYSIYDAIRGGFGKVVFVIRKDFEQDFREKILSKYENHIPVELVFQALDNLPEGFTCPADRVKPWGTNHAVAVLGAELSQMDGKKNDYCMVGYRVGNTLSESGSVARGVCETNAEGYLTTVVERTAIERIDGKVSFKDENGEMQTIGDNTPVSMNMWGFTPDYFAYSEEYFKEFLKENEGNLKSEYFIPLMVNKLVNEGTARVKVLDTTSKWFGVTYAADRQGVVDKIQALVDAGEYPDKLF